MQIAEMILAVPEKDLEKTLTSVMQDVLIGRLLTARHVGRT